MKPCPLSIHFIILKLLISDSRKQGCSNGRVSSLNLWTFLPFTHLALRVYVHFEIHSEHVGNYAMLHQHSNTSHLLIADTFGIPKILHRLLDMIISSLPNILPSFQQHHHHSQLTSQPAVKDATRIKFSSVQKKFSEVPQGPQSASNF